MRLYTLLCRESSLDKGCLHISVFVQQTCPRTFHSSAHWIFDTDIHIRTDLLKNKLVRLSLSSIITHSFFHFEPFFHFFFIFYYLAYYLTSSQFFNYYLAVIPPIIGWCNFEPILNNLLCVYIWSWRGQLRQPVSVCCVRKRSPHIEFPEILYSIDLRDLFCLTQAV